MLTKIMLTSILRLTYIFNYPIVCVHTSWPPLSVPDTSTCPCRMVVIMTTAV